VYCAYAHVDLPYEWAGARSAADYDRFLDEPGAKLLLLGMHATAAPADVLYAKARLSVARHAVRRGDAATILPGLDGTWEMVRGWLHPAYVPGVLHPAFFTDVYKTAAACAPGDTVHALFLVGSGSTFNEARGQSMYYPALTALHYYACSAERTPGGPLVTYVCDVLPGRLETSKAAGIVTSNRYLALLHLCAVGAAVRLVEEAVLQRGGTPVVEVVVAKTVNDAARMATDGIAGRSGYWMNDAGLRNTRHIRYVLSLDHFSRYSTPDQLIAAAEAREGDRPCLQVLADALKARAAAAAAGRR
jgi:hypothetical protein